LFCPIQLIPVLSPTLFNSLNSDKRTSDQIPESLFIGLIKFCQTKFDLIHRFVFVGSENPVPKDKDVCKIGIRIILILFMVDLVQVGCGENQSQSFVQPGRETEIGMMENLK
jgi:hypothetical protein